MLESYRLYSKLRVFRYRVEGARQIIRNALEISRKPYVACSWGKDSICLLHLVVQERPDVDVIWIRSDEFDEWPNTDRIANEFAGRWPISLHTARTMPVTDCYRQTGGFYVFAETAGQKEADRQYSREFIKAIISRARNIDSDLAFIGLRQEESFGRRVMLRKMGNTFFAKSNEITESFPLSDWTGKDVWAYIAVNDLPYLALYDLAEDRERARNGAMFAANVPSYGGAMHYNGQLAALKKIYPDLFNRFAAEFPEVRCYV